jgi:hypothetical protein
MSTTTVVRKLARRSAARVTPKVLEEDPLDLSQTNALNQLNLDASTVVSKGKVVAKSPKKTKKSPAKKSPARKVSKKSPAKKPAVKKPAAKKIKAKPRHKIKAKKDTKSKRPHNTKPTTLDVNGIGIGPARVRSVLTDKSLNPREHIVRMAIAQAENKPVMPKPTKEEPNPVLPDQGRQVNIDDMHPKCLAVIREAEAVHEAAIREGYERTVLSSMTAKIRAKYLVTRKAAHCALNEANAGLDGGAESTDFDLKAFNEEYKADFYGGYKAYCVENDSYVVGTKYNQWGRASALVNKLTIRLSGNTRYILATLLDRMVMQYAYNGITNCLLEKRHIVMLRHALSMTKGFNQRVPLDCFVKTFKNYEIALDWIQECAKVKEEVKALRAEKKFAEFEYPPYPDMNYDAIFDGYVGEICRSVKMRLSGCQKTTEEKDRYMNTSVSAEFKRFCSYIIYEAILRIGAILRTTIARDKVKTVSDSMVYFALEQCHNVCGLDFGPAREVMDSNLAKFALWRADRKEERKQLKLNEGKDGGEITVDGEEEEDAESEDEAEVDAESEDEAEEDIDAEESDAEIEYEAE